MNAAFESRQYSIEVGAGGLLRFPSQVLAALRVTTGDTLSLIELDSFLLLLPKPLIVPTMADAIADLLAAKGITTDDLIADLDNTGREVFEEQYGPIRRD